MYVLLRAKCMCRGAMRVCCRYLVILYVYCRELYRELCMCVLPRAMQCVILLSAVCVCKKCAWDAHVLRRGMCEDQNPVKTKIQLSPTSSVQDRQRIWALLPLSLLHLQSCLRSACQHKSCSRALAQQIECCPTMTTGRAQRCD